MDGGRHPNRKVAVSWWKISGPYLSLSLCMAKSKGAPEAGGQAKDGKFLRALRLFVTELLACVLIVKKKGRGRKGIRSDGG